MACRCLLVFFVATFSLVSGQSLIYGLKGLQVNLKGQVPEHPDEILWKHNGNKVVEYYNKKEQEYGSYTGRVTLDLVSAELKINNLTYEDSGEYVLEVYRNTNFQSFRLEVIDKVAKPTISCGMNDTSSSNTHGNQATLICSVESTQPPSLMTFEWISNGQIQPGPKLAITLGGVHDNEEYRCSVKNPLTYETATFSAKDCYTDKGPNVALIAGLSVLFGVCALALVLGILVWKRCHPGGNNDLEKHLPPTTDGSNRETAQNEECERLFHRAPTSCPEDDRDGRPQKGTVRKRINQFDTNRSFTQFLPTDTLTGLEKNTDKKTLPPSLPLSRKASFCQDSNNDEGHADVDELRELDPSISEKTTEPDPVALINLTGDVSTGLQSSPAPQQPEPEKNGDDDEEAKSHPANSISPPVAKPDLCLSYQRSNMETKETTDFDQVTGETLKEKVRESDSLGLVKINDTDDSAVPQQKSAETTAHEKDSNLPQEETGTTENDHKERDKPVSEDVNESDHDQEEIDKENNFSLDSPQSPPKPDI